MLQHQPVLFLTVNRITGEGLLLLAHPAPFPALPALFSSGFAEDFAQIGDQQLPPAADERLERDLAEIAAPAGMPVEAEDRVRNRFLVDRAAAADASLLLGREIDQADVFSRAAVVLGVFVRDDIAPVRLDAGVAACADRLG